MTRPTPSRELILACRARTRCWGPRCPHVHECRGIPARMPLPRLPWGRYRSQAMRAYPAIAWRVLTDAQIDVLYLTCAAGLSRREIAERCQTSQLNVARHLSRALERLSTPPPSTSGRKGARQ